MGEEDRFTGQIGASQRRIAPVILGGCLALAKNPSYDELTE
jgi:hypothetical protein